MNSHGAALGFSETNDWNFKGNSVSCIMKIGARGSEIWSVTINNVLLVSQAGQTWGNFAVNENIMKYN